MYAKSIMHYFTFVKEELVDLSPKSNQIEILVWSRSGDFNQSAVNLPQSLKFSPILLNSF